jgi:hypothetical protein
VFMVSVLLKMSLSDNCKKYHELTCLLICLVKLAADRSELFYTCYCSEAACSYPIIPTYNYHLLLLFSKVC